MRAGDASPTRSVSIRTFTARRARSGEGAWQPFSSRDARLNLFEHLFGRDRVLHDVAAARLHRDRRIGVTDPRAVFVGEQIRHDRYCSKGRSAPRKFGKLSIAQREGGPLAQVFVSYDSDDRERIVPLVEALQRADLSVWWDRRIDAGASFDLIIERELDSAQCVVVAWSTHSVASEWVRNEATEAAERRVLVPLLIDAVKPPLAFRRLQTIDLVGWPQHQDGDQLERLIAEVCRLVGVERTSSGAASEIRVGVLPFADLTPEADMAYLANGLAEDLMNALFTVKGLRVLSSRDTAAFGGSRATVREIGAALNANVVLEGSVQRADRRVAVGARLVDVANGVTLYAERFVRNLDDVFELQSEIANRVVEGLRGRLGASALPDQPTSSAPRDPQAYALHREASSPAPPHSHAFHPALRTVALLECAIALDPGYERAYSELAIGYMRSSAIVSSRGGRARAQQLLDGLEQRQPNSLAGWAIRVELASDMTELAAECSRQIANGERLHAYPHPTGGHDVRAGYARALAHSGLYREALDYFALIDRRDEPNRFDNWLHQLGCLIAVGDYAAALGRIDRMRVIADDLGPLVPAWEVTAHIALGDWAAAGSTMIGDSPYARLFQSILRHRMGEAPEFDDDESTPEHAEASIYGMLAVGRTEQGLAALERHVEVMRADGDLHWLAFRLPIFAVLFGDEVKRHATYRRVVDVLGLDRASRERLQRQVASLTAITGIAPAPLLDI
jgi:TolB-like protein